MRDVANPVEAACSTLRAAWHASGSHDQLTDFILSLDGIRPQLERKLCRGSGETIMQHVLRSRLQDLEAERLTALCELDRAQRDVDAYKQELIQALASRIKRETSELEEIRDQARSQVDELTSNINTLTQHRDALLTRIHELQNATLPEAASSLLAQMNLFAPMNGIPLRLSPEAGILAEPDELIGRLMRICRASGVDIVRNTAIVLLVLLAMSPRIGLACSTPAPLSTLIQNIANAMGWSRSFAHQTTAEQRPISSEPPVNAAPAVLMTSLPNYAELQGIHKLLMNRNSVNLSRNAAYDANAWPILMLPALPFVPEIAAEEAVPIAAISLQKMIEKKSATDEELDRILTPVLDSAAPLSGAARKSMYAFTSVCAGLLEGGLPVAVDWAIALWICPALERGTRHYTAVKAVLDEYPIALSKL